MTKNNKFEIPVTSKQTAALIAGKILAQVVTFAIPLFLIRYLSKADYGLYSQFYMVVTFFTCFFGIGFETNLFYFYPLASSEDKKSLVFQTFIFLVFFAIIAMAFTQIPIIEKELIGSNELVNYQNLIVVGIFFMMPMNIIEPLYVVRKDFKVSIFYPPVEVILRLLMVIIFAIVQPGLKSVCTGIVVAAAFCLVFTLGYTFRDFNFRDLRIGMIKIRLIRKQLLYNLPFGIAMSLNLLMLRFDKIICIRFLTPSDFATYTVAFFGIPGIMQIYDSFTKVQVIEMTIKYHENQINQISEIYKALALKAYSFSVPLLMIVALYSRKIVVFLFTSKYIESVPFFRLYLLSFLVFMLGAGLILRATDRTKDTLKAYAFSSLITLPVTFFLTKKFGMWGAMSSALFSLILPRLLMIYYEIRILNLNLASYFPWKKIFVIISISIICLLPFAVLEFFFRSGVFLTLCYGLTYLVLVTALELKYNLFVVPSYFIKGRFEDFMTIARSLRHM